MVSVVDIDRDTAQEAAERELRRAIYPREGLLDRVRGWFDELIGRLIGAGSEIPGGFFTISILLILVVLAVVVAVRVARNTLHTNRTQDYGVFGATELTAAQHRHTADQYARQGDWPAAIRHRLRAVARQLEETGVLDPVPGRTAFELARSAGSAIPALSGQFQDAATAFNEVAFGRKDGTPEAYRLISHLDDQLCSGAIRAVTR